MSQRTVYLTLFRELIYRNMRWNTRNGERAWRQEKICNVHIFTTDPSCSSAVQWLWETSTFSHSSIGHITKLRIHGKYRHHTNPKRMDRRPFCADVQKHQRRGTLLPLRKKVQGQLNSLPWMRSQTQEPARGEELRAISIVHVASYERSAVPGESSHCASVQLLETKRVPPCVFAKVLKSGNLSAFFAAHQFLTWILSYSCSVIDKAKTYRWCLAGILKLARNKQGVCSCEVFLL
jgi:hypothetical protein